MLVTAGARRAGGGVGSGGGAVPPLRHKSERLVRGAGRRSLRTPPQRRCLPGRPGVLWHAVSGRVGGGVPVRPSRLRVKLPDRRLHEHTAATGGTVVAATWGLLHRGLSSPAMAALTTCAIQHMIRLFCFTEPGLSTQWPPLPRAFARGREPGFAVGQLADLAAARNSEGVVP
jgi:hypothetical protein